MPSVLERLARENVRAKARVEEYLRRVVPGIEGVESKRVGHMESLEFRQRVEGQREPWKFPAINMSDGTLRVLGTLVALFQHAGSGDVPLVGIEEPEMALHPAATGLLLDALSDAARHTQVLVTSHSPDLLDDQAVSSEQILAVVAPDGRTELGPVDQAGRAALVQHLYTAGELLRADQLRPDPVLIDKAHHQLSLFEPPEETAG